MALLFKDFDGQSYEYNVLAYEQNENFNRVRLKTFYFQEESVILTLDDNENQSLLRLTTTEKRGIIK